MKAALFISVLLVPLPLAGHPDPSHTLQQLEEHLAKTPNDLELLRQKAGLYLVTGHPDFARPVVDQLLKLAPDPPEEPLLDARVRFAENDPSARGKATAITAAHPNFAPGWNFLSHVEDAAGHRDEAIAAMRHSLDLDPKPSPTDVLTAAGWLADRNRPGDTEAAIAIIDQGLAKLGVLTGLHYHAIELEIKLGRTDAALRRLDALAARFRPSVDLSLRRAAILEKAGRYHDAAAACDSALAVLDALPASRKNQNTFREQFDAILKRKAENLAR